MSRRLFALLALLCLCLASAAPPARAESSGDDDGIYYIEPKLSEDAVPWDATHPELLDPEMLYAKSAILVEADTGEVLFEKDADAIMFPASTSKILTAYIALQVATELESDLVTISQSAIDLVPEGYTKVPFSAGEQVYMSDLLPAMLVRSGNEAANAVAEHISGSVSNFAELMNRTASMLGCSEDTHFVNPSGAHDPGQYTTARDMAIIARAAMKDERFRQYVSSHTYDMPATKLESGAAGHPQRQLVGGTDILNNESSAYYRSATGIKTGYTDAAGYCFVGSAERGGIELISVVFYTSAAGRWSDTRKLMEYGFTQIESISPESLYAEEPRVIEVAGFSLDDPFHGELTLGIRATEETQTRDMTIVGNKERIDFLRENFNQVSAIEWVKEFRAPIAMGDVMGKLTFYSESSGTAEYDLVATRSVEAREDAPPTLEQIEAYTAADENPLPRLSGDLFVPPALAALGVFLVLRFISRHRKKRAKAPKVKPVRKRYLR